MTLSSTPRPSEPRAVAPVSCGCGDGICYRDQLPNDGSTTCVLKNAAAPVVVRESIGVKVVPQGPTTARILRAMATTFEERNKVYGSNYKMVGPIMAILFPNGLSPELLGSDQFHLFELVIVKLSRLAISDLKHQDSAHDAGVYCAMIESIIANPPQL